MRIGRVGLELVVTQFFQGLDDFLLRALVIGGRLLPRLGQFGAIRAEEVGDVSPKRQFGLEEENEDVLVGARVGRVEVGQVNLLLFGQLLLQVRTTGQETVDLLVQLLRLLAEGFGEPFIEGERSEASPMYGRESFGLVWKGVGSVV